MDNIVLFVCGLAVTLMSAMGILVYMVSVGYEHQKETLERKKADEARLKEKVDADLGAIEKTIANKVEETEADSVAGIPSVS